jgi:hypothetical protein
MSHPDEFPSEPNPGVLSAADSSAVEDFSASGHLAVPLSWPVIADALASAMWLGAVVWAMGPGAVCVLHIRIGGIYALSASPVTQPATTPPSSTSWPHSSANARTTSTRTALPK